MSSILSLPFATASHLINLSWSYISGTQQAASQQTNNENTSAEYLVLEWLDARFKRFQLLLLWRKPIKTLIALPILWLAFVSLLDLLTKLRFYSIIFGALFIHQFTVVWFRHVWPEIRVPTESEAAAPQPNQLANPEEKDLLTLSKLQVKLSNLIKFSEDKIKILLEFREREPINFCLAVCSLFLCTSFIGNRISGDYIVREIFMLILLVPGVLQSRSLRAWLDSLRKTVNQSISTLTGNQQSTPPPTSDANHHDDDPHATLQSTHPLHNATLFDQLKHVSFLTCFNSSLKTTPEEEQLVTNRDTEGEHYREQEMIEQSAVPSTYPILVSSHAVEQDDDEDEMQEGFVIL